MLKFKASYTTSCNIYYRNVFIIFSLHTEMDVNRCYANYTVCASVFVHFCMQRKNNENIPYNLITNKIYI